MIFTASRPRTLRVLLPAAVLRVVDFLSIINQWRQVSIGEAAGVTLDSSEGSYFLPDGDAGLQLADAVLDRLLAVVAVRRRDRHDDAGLAHLHPPEGGSSAF